MILKAGLKIEQENKTKKDRSAVKRIPVQKKEINLSLDFNHDIAIRKSTGNLFDHSDDFVPQTLFNVRNGYYNRIQQQKK